MEEKKNYEICHQLFRFGNMGPMVFAAWAQVMSTIITIGTVLHF